MIFDHSLSKSMSSCAIGLPLDGIGAQQLRPGTALEHRDELPAEIECVLHRHVHALPGLGAVRVASVAGDEHARQTRVRLCERDIVEAVGHPLADLVHREPHDVAHVERVRVQHALRDLDDLLGGVLPVRGAIARVDLAQIDVQPHEVAALARE